MKKPVRACVKCGTSLQYNQILAAGPFSCPVCHAQLQVPDAYALWIAVGNLLFSAVVFGTLGFRGLHLLYAILLVWLPIQYIAINFLNFVIPPKIEIYLPKNATLHLRSGPRS